MTTTGPEVELYWIPLGAGTPIVQWNGRAYEALVSRLQRRSPRDLYHSSLIVTVDGARYTIEMTPVPDGNGSTRGVVAEGPVGLRWLGRFRVFRYEIRRWRNGVIPDVAWAMDSPRTLAEDAATAYRILDLVPEVPTPVWGLDELSAGEMWNSNSVVSWLLERGGIEVDAVVPPPNGRAPGWDAGVVVARRDQSTGDVADSEMTGPGLPEGSRATAGGRAELVTRGRLQDPGVKIRVRTLPWRRGWDLNPRSLAGHTISNAGGSVRRRSHLCDPPGQRGCVAR
ncbi:MAG TPA: hypothetical protein VFH50_06550 [Acidimicrobiales bacterium]|nr:hypothetical protein [Acidimicrobiales bacterium]